MTNEVYVMHLCSVTASQMQIPLWDKELGHVTIDTNTHHVTEEETLSRDTLF